MPGARGGRLGGWVLAGALLAAALAGCADTAEERTRLFTEDGIFLYGRGEYDSARQSFECALRLKPDDPALLYDVGQCWDRQGDAPRAERAYRDCLQVAANHAPCHHALAALLLREGRRKEADELVEGWLAGEPKLADAYALDGWRLRQDGDLLQAQGRLQQALELDPHNVRALVELGILYEALERPARALDLYDRALALDPGLPEVAGRAAKLRAGGVGRPLPD